MLLAGFPHILPEIEPTRLFKEEGIFDFGSRRLVPIVLSLFSPLIGWQELMPWIYVNASFLSLALIAWWVLVYRMFNTKVAWISTVVFALLPLYWIKALTIDGYSLGFLFLFLSFISFRELMGRSRMGAIVLSGIFFGLALASRDVFILFLPWFGIAYLWIERNRWKKAIVEGVVFALLSAAIFSFPYIASGNLMEAFSPRQAGWGHFYPDQYTYEFEKEEYEELSTKEFKSRTWLEQTEHRHYRLIFGVDEKGPLIMLWDGLWLFVNRIPSFFMMDTVGGLFIWLFIIPGAIVLSRSNKRLLILMIGLGLSVELIVRFYFHFQRIHLMNYGWILALLSGFGVVYISEKTVPSKKKKAIAIASTFIVILIAGQLVQANRKQFARLYERSKVPQAIAAAEQLKKFPEDSRVAYPIAYRNYLALSDVQGLYFHEDTVARLVENRKLREAFNHYGITHVIGYPKESIDGIKRLMPGIKVVEPVEGGGVEVTPVVRYLLHLVR